MNACVRPAPCADPALGRFAADVREGLGRRPKSLPPAHLYDALGSALFEAITQLPEYGVWRAERRILERCATEVAARCPATRVVELGSGSATKTRLLLAALLRHAAPTYCAIDVSRAALESTRAALHDLDGLSVHLVEADYAAGFAHAAAARGDADRVLVLFLGGSLGNFAPAAALELLGRIRRGLRPGDALLVGADLDKPAQQLIAAYDDPLGVTAAFDLNLLVRMNRELGADFRLERFRHRARFDARSRDVEMHLESLCRQEVRFTRLDFAVAFEAGETIHTESSHKYREAELDMLAAAAGFRRSAAWRDEAWPFVDALYLAA
jgi:dimethylhistidine N-methyltransferase